MNRCDEINFIFVNTMSSLPKKTQKSKLSFLALRVRELRKENEITLKALSERSGISIASLSKIENNQLQPTYDKILNLAKGLDVDISTLFHAQPPKLSRTRLSVTETENGIRHDSDHYIYEMLNTDLTNKKMIPLKALIKSGIKIESHDLIAHDGEEFVLVLSGAIIVHTEHYAPRLLKKGDSAYFDSTMRHVIESTEEEDASVFWMCSSENAVKKKLGVDNISIKD